MISTASVMSKLARYGHTQRAWRRRQALRWQRPAVSMPTAYMARYWPRLTGGPRSIRWPLNFARWYQARIAWGTVGWLHRLLGASRSLLGRFLAACLLASWLWVTALAYLLAGLAAGALFLFITLPIRAVGLSLAAGFAWRGWTAPGAFNDLDQAVLAQIEASIDRTPPRDRQPISDPWAWNDEHDPQLQIQRAMVDQLAEANRIAAADLANRAAPQPYTAANPGYLIADAARPSLRGPVAVLAVMAALMALGAWRLHNGAASVPEPPSWDQIHAQADPTTSETATP